MDEESGTLVAQYIRMWNDGDTRIAAELISEHWRNHSRPEENGPDGVTAAVAAARVSHPELRVYVDTTLGNGEFVTVNVRIESAARLERAVWIFRATRGRLQEMWSFAA